MGVDYRVIANEVRAALEEKAQREMGLTSGDPLPLFLDLTEHVKQIVPAVQEIYDRLFTVGRLWKTNQVDQILAATPPGQIPLGQGNLTAEQWKDLQRLFLALQGWIEMPIVLPEDPEGTPPGPVPIAVISQRPKGTVN